ncbi:A disintegrin and metalloproteinase with thrombospondin motifs 2-like [Babylonia areolata]|uniref:A disintegrin and metalloproteinase with thrombospondin motifs 2-like n=1 Tax=Babylonia areolata TaxID=304850 RepID=UPI003FD17711
MECWGWVVLCLLLATTTIGSSTLVDDSRTSAAAAELPIQTSCEVDRAEVVYPSIVTARKSGAWSKGTTRKPPPTLEVQLSWRGRQRLLTLFQNDVAAGGMVMVYEEGEGEGRRGVPDNDTVVVETGGESCYYEGYLKGEGASYAAVSACDGLAGYIQTDVELLFIEAAPAEREGGRGWNSRPHVLYACAQSGPISAGNATDTGEGLPAPTADPRPRRRRRSTGRKRYLEVMVVVDHTLVNMHGKGRIKNYILTLMNIVNSVYQHHTLGVNLRVVVTEILLLKPEEQKQVLVTRDAYRTVQQFCQWMAHRVHYAQNVKHDIAVYLTREKMGPAGYAPITGLCHPHRSCAAVTDEGFTSGFIIAHEMAHVFGLFHDGHGNHCSGRQYQSAIMAPLVEAKLNRFWWSECSKQRMQHVINYLYCLNDEPDMARDVNHYQLDSGPQLPKDMGKHWSLDFQCRLEFGDRFGLCASFPSDQCHMLWCSDRSSPHHCRTKRGPPAPGTSCGRDRECRNYRCTYVGREKPVDGKWSSWSAWEPCSADCSVGITRRHRSCTNPSPAYGGKECEGESEGWDTCVAKECETYYDSREAHCAVWNDMNIRRGRHDWKSYPAKKESDRCKQTCISSQTKEVVTIDVEVSDGTPCDYDHPTNICFMGKCLAVGCDGVQNSTKDYDSCGVCGGDDSQCKNVSGVFNRAPATGDEYETIIFLPKGARNIHIERKGSTNHFIALKDADYGTYPLNGNKRQESSRQFILAGARVNYRNKPGSQTIATSGPVHANLEVMLYPNKDERKATVSYSYSISKDDYTLEKRKYQWRFKEWSECSVTCGEGVTTILHACHDKDTGDRVENDMCQYLDPPRKDEAACSREPCSQRRYMWAMTNDWSECSAEGCGQEGVERQGYECQLYFMNNDTYSVVDLHLCDQSIVPDDETRPCHSPPCPQLNWTIGAWSECSVSCGKGRQTRSVHCGDPDTDSDDIYCKDLPPALSRSCKKKRCKGSANGSQCRDKYSFCARANGLSLKCRSARFKEICCRSCRRERNAARTRSPKLSEWDKYRRRQRSRRRRRRY